VNSRHFQPTALMLALAAAFPVWAQSADSAASNQEVVVTATKRSTTALKTPLSLSVISGDDLKSAGVATVSNLTDQIPNTAIGKGWGNAVEITLRGIGSNDNTERGDPAAAFHVDGVYFGRTRMAGGTFFDIERVEVLRGPQGTLYGRNANAGVVNVITAKPKAKLEGSVGLDVGSFGDVRAEGMVNVPVNDMIALRAAVVHEKNDGYTKLVGQSGGRDDTDNTAGRLQAQIKFSPNTTWLLSADSSVAKGHGAATFDITNGRPAVLNQQSPQQPGSEDNKVSGLSSELRTNVGFADFTYIYGARHDSQDETASWGNAPSLWTHTSSSFDQRSHELRLSSLASNPVQWIVGAYLFNSTNHKVNFPLYFGASSSQIVRFLQDPAINDSKALFGQVTYPVSTDLRLTAGVRYTQDHKARKGTTFDGADNPIGAVGNNADAHWKKSTYKLGLEYDLDKTSLVFASLATGFKAGGFNDGNDKASDANFNPFLYYKPESITSLEAGHKGRFMGGKLQISTTAFAYSYNDMQVQSSVGNSQETFNAGKARVTGLESEGRLRVTEQDRLDFGLGILDSKYTQYIVPNGSSFNGQTLDKSPRLTFNLGYSHSWNLSDGAVINAKLGLRYSDKYKLLNAGTPSSAPTYFEQASYTRTNLTTTYSPASDQWSVQAFVNNLEDKRQLSAILPLGASTFGFFNDPRTYGVRANFKF